MSNLVALPGGTELAGDFRIKRVLGAGGFGITYLADELALARQVTIKEYFPTDYAARKNDLAAFPRSRESAEDYKWGLDRFIDEAKTLARFDHPNIVRVYRYFRANNTGYMVLHFEEGGSFKTWLRGLGRAPRQTELDALLAPLLDALEVIHKGDFLHRDIAPDNIIVRKDKTPVLIDFGSARGEMAEQSRTVSALVKPGYSPYEQYASTTRQQGPWTDIYALGATFYQAICGKRPPDAPSRMVRDEYVSAREAAIGSYRAGFLAAIDKALRLEVTERPQSIADWRGPLLAPDPKPAAAKAPRARIGDVLGLKRTQALAEAALAVAEPQPLAAASEANQPPPPDTPQPRGQLLDFVDGLRKAAVPATPVMQPGVAALPAAAAPAAGSLGAALSVVETAPHFGLGYGGVPAAAVARPEALPQHLPTLAGARATVLPKAPSASLPASLPSPLPASVLALPPASLAIERRRPRRRPQMWFFLRSPWRGLLARFATGIAVASLLTVYQHRWQDRWPLASIAHGPATARRATAKPVVLAPRVENADQKSEQKVERAADLRTENAALLQPASQQLIGPTGTVTAVRFLGESRRVVTVSTDGALRLWDATTGALVRSIALPDGAATALAAQETQALTGHADGTLSLWDLDTGDRIAVFHRSADALTAVAFAPETDHFVAADKTGNLAVFNRKSPGAPVLVRDQTRTGGAVTALVRVAAHDAVAYVLADNTVRLSNSEDLSQIRSYRGHAGAITAIDSPENGRALAAAASDGQIRVWSTRSSRMIKSFQAHVGAITALSYAPSGDVLASTGTDGVLKIWDARHGRLLAAAPWSAGKVQAITLGADGRHIATAQADGSIRLWDVGGPKLARE